MNVLLINPPTDSIITTTQAKYVISERGLVPPLGLLYLASAVKQKTQHTVRIIDCQLDNPSEAQIYRELAEFEPDVVGITFITFMLIDCVNMVELVRKFEKAHGIKIAVVAGGPHVTVFPQETAELSGIDYALAGEAEFSFIDLLNGMQTRHELYSIPGIHYMENGTMVKGPAHTYTDDLDSIPVPDRTLLAYDRYANVLSGGGIMTTMMTSRGCPYQCIFCDRLGKKFRAISAEGVVSEIRHCIELGIQNIFFHDDTFTINKNRVMEICRRIKERRLKFQFSLRSRVNTIDEDMVRALKESGCQRISFGVESGVQKILNRIKKGITLEQVENAFRLTRKYDIVSLADFMIGHPDETVDDIRQTIRFAKKIKPDFVQFSVTTPYPGTELYHEGLTRGIIERDVWREFAQNPTLDFIPPRWEENIDRKTLYEILHECYRMFYLSPSFVIKNILKIKDHKEFKRKMRAGIELIKNELLTKIGAQRDGFR